MEIKVLWEPQREGNSPQLRSPGMPSCRTQCVHREWEKREEENCSKQADSGAGQTKGDWKLILGEMAINENTSRAGEHSKALHGACVLTLQGVLRGSTPTWVRSGWSHPSLLNKLCPPWIPAWGWAASRSRLTPGGCDPEPGSSTATVLRPPVWWVGDTLC